MILHSGGLRSLVATALTLQQQPTPRVSLLHLDDGREAEPRRRDMLKLQAERYELTRVTLQHARHLFAHGHGRDADGKPRGLVIGPRLLLSGLAEAAFQRCDTLVWPVSGQGEPDLIAAASERAMLCEQLAQPELESAGRAAPRLDMPLVEMSDAQVLELGQRLGVDWSTAWSCHRAGDRPCGMCAGCQRRHIAFDAAKLSDPLIQSEAKVPPRMARAVARVA